MKKNIKYLLLILCSILGQSAMAQVRISGTVSDPEGPVMLCNVVEVDANNRNVSYAQTDINGNFTMQVKSTKNKLKISYIGCQTAVLPIGDRTRFDVKLKSQTTLKEVEVIGGNRKRQGGLLIPEKEISAAQQTFNMSEVEGLAFTTADEALQGQIAGLDIVSNSGNLGAGTTMRLRGITSITGSSEPLIVLDGYIFDNPDENFDFENGNEETYASLLSINPQDIATIEVLKDAAATAIWGSRGANGVISITTKRGARGKPHVDYSYRLQTNWQPKGYELLNGDDYTMMLKEMYYNPNQSATATTNINEINYPLVSQWAEAPNWDNNTDWVKAVSKVGFSQNHNFVISGGGEKADFRISASYDHQTGTIIEQKLQRFSTKLNLRYHVSDRIRVDVNFPLTYTNNHQNYDGLLGIAQRLAPNMSIYRQDANGNDTDEYYIMLPSGASNAAGSSMPGTSSAQLGSIRGMGNPVAIAHLAWKESRTYRISPDFRINYKLLGKDDDKTQLDYEGTVYMDIFSSNNPQYKSGALTTNGWRDGSYNVSETSDNSSLGVTTRHTLTFHPKFRNRDFSQQMLLRGEIHISNNSSQSVRMVNLPTGVEATTVDADLASMGTGNGEGRSASWMYQIHNAYKDGRYVLDFTLRADGSSRFGNANRWRYFPSVSARWNIIEEPFMQWSRSVLSRLSFRPSWGYTGNQPGGEYKQWPSYITSGVYGNGIRNYPVSYTSALTLDKVEPEQTNQINLGTDIGFFNDRVTLDFNYFYKNTKKMLMGVRIPSQVGYTNLGSANVGEMTNTGWELNFHVRDLVKVGKFSMDFGFNTSQYFNNIVEMDPTVLESINADWNPDSRGSYLNRIQEGNPLGSIYGLKFKGVYQYSYEWLENYRNSHPELADNEAYRDWLNNEFLGKGKTAPIAVDNEGQVMMDARGNPIQMVYNYRDGNSTYEFQGGDAIYEDINNDGQINALDIMYLGNSNPKVQGGFQMSFRYGDWQVRTNWTFRGGFKVINNARMNLEEMFNSNNQSIAVNWRWRKNGDVTTIPRALFNQGYNFLGSDRYVEDASFLRLSYLQLNYNFKKKFIKQLGLNRLSMSASTQNVLVFTKYSGTDPEHGAGGWGVATDGSQTPRARSITFNLTIGF